MKVTGIALTPAEDAGGMRWTEDVLEEATETLVGVPIKRSFGGDGGDQIGEVTDAQYVDGVGVEFDAEIEQEHLLQEEYIAPETSIGEITREEDGTFTVGKLGFRSMAPVKEANELVGEYEVIEE